MGSLHIQYAHTSKHRGGDAYIQVEPAHEELTAMACTQ
jgi:hypothetical protein